MAIIFLYSQDSSNNSKQKKMIEKYNENRHSEEIQQTQQKNIFEVLCQLEFNKKSLQAFYENHLKQLPLQRVRQMKKQFSNLQSTDQETLLTKTHNCIKFYKRQQKTGNQKDLLLEYQLLKCHLESAKNMKLPINQNTEAQNIHQVNNLIIQPRSFFQKFRKIITDLSIANYSVGLCSSSSQSHNIKSSSKTYQQTKSSQPSLRSQARQSSTEVTKNNKNNSEVKKTKKNQQALHQIQDDKKQEQEGTLIGHDHND